MNTYIITLGQSNKTFELQADTLCEVELLIANDMPEEWYGLTIVQKDTPKNKPTFMCNAVKECYKDVKKTPLELATFRYVQSIRMKNEAMRETYYDIYEHDECTRSISLSTAFERGLITEIK